MGDVDIGFVVPVINAAGAAAHILGGGYADIEYELSVYLILHRREIKRWVHFVLVIDRRHEFLFNLIYFILLNAKDLAIILHAEEDMPAFPVGKSAYRLIYILRNFRS